MWLLIAIAAVAAGALVVWHEVARNKQLAFMLLKKYEELLARAREEKAKEAARARKEAEAGEPDGQSEHDAT